MPIVQIKPDDMVSLYGNDVRVAQWYAIPGHTRIEWCMQNCKGKWQLGDPISNYPPNWPAWFELIDDALRFKLVWG
jgi:hypothetical protein